MTEGLPGVFREQGYRDNFAMGTWEKIVGNTGTSNAPGNTGTDTKTIRVFSDLS